MTATRIQFDNGAGQTLAGRLVHPAGPVRATALLAHCFTCGKDLPGARHIARELAQRGFLVMQFDFTGLGASEGDFAKTTFASNVDDLCAAAEWLGTHHGAPALLVGHSLGGPAVLIAASRLASVKAVVTIGAPAAPGHVTHLFDDADSGEGDITTQLGRREITIGRDFINDVKRTDLTKTLGTLRTALLFLHSPQDTVVGVENARTLYDAARHPKSFISLDGADHLLTNKRDAIYVAEVVASWGARYLPAVKQPQATHSQHVEVVSDEGLLQHVFARGHRLLADEPRSVGGRNAGMTPYDLLLGALGTCTSMTLRMYAARKKWPLDAVRVHLEHDRIHAADCENCEFEDGQVDQLTRVIELEGADLTDEMRTRLLQIADRCPVHRTLEGQIHIATRLQ